MHDALSIYLLFALHAVFHPLLCLCPPWVCVCLCVLHEFGTDASLSLLAFNLLVTVTMVTVLWKSSLPTTSEMPPAHLNIIFACCLNINCCLVRQPFEYCLCYWLMFYGCFVPCRTLSCMLTPKVFLYFVALVDVASTRLKVVGIFCFSWCWLAWVWNLSILLIYSFIFAWLLFRILCLYI